MDVSIVIRTFNESRHLGALLDAIARQTGNLETETIIVDSGSTDGSVEIAEKSGCRVLGIARKDFTFGRSLNLGCDAARGEVLVFVSGHCVPCDHWWLEELTAPVRRGAADYAYGRQIGGEGTRFSEHQVFAKYYPEASRIPQDGYFCNNANAALDRATWESIRFDESLTGLEDMKMAKDIVGRNGKIAYVAEAPVFHLHDETWHQVRIRYEREALALREIMPEVHVTFGDFMRYFTGGVLHDFGNAMERKSLMSQAREIVMFRLMQFWGTWRGNREHRQISARQREEYFYPGPGRAGKSGTAAGSASTVEGS